MAKTTTTVHENHSAETTKLITDDSIKDNKVSPTLANDNTEPVFHISIPTKQTSHPVIEAASEIKCGNSNDVFDVKTCGGELDKNVVKLNDGERCTMDILDEPVTQSVFPQESQVKQVERGRCISDVFPTEPVSVTQVKHVDREKSIIDVDVFTTNVSKGGRDDQPVTVDISRTLVPGDNVVNEIMGSCLTDVLDSLATEPGFVPDDQVNNQVEYKARSINVWGADRDNQS